MATLVKLGNPLSSTPSRVFNTAPQTPASQTAGTPGSDPPTGTWRHPRLDEITKRQRASSFTDSNLRIILWNVFFLFVSFLAVRIVRGVIQPDILNLVSSTVVYPRIARWVVRFVFIYNIGSALWPLFRRKDDLADIPLTPSQRALLGLDPDSAPATPDSHYITPPRYSRSATPRSSGSQGGSRGLRRDSPLSNRDRGSPLGLVSGSPASGSPLLHKAFVSGGLSRRHSQGSQSPLGGSVFGPDPSSSGSNLPPTPTPVNGKHASVMLNNKWLYERGRSSLGGRNLYS